MTTKTKQRTLIHEDKGILKTMLKDVDEMMPILKKIQSSYNGLEIGKLDNEIFHDILNKGTARIKRQYLKKEEEQIKKAGITSARIKENLMNGADEEFEKFNTQVKRLKEFHAFRYGMDNTPRLPLKFIHCFHFGGFAVTDEGEAEILEQYCRVYLDGPEEHETHQKVQEFLSSFKVIKNHLDKIGYIYKEGNDYGFSSIISSFLTFKDGEPCIKPTSIRYAVSGQKEWEAEKQRQREHWRKVNDELRAPTLNELEQNNQ